MKPNSEDRLQNEKIQSLREFLIEKFNNLETNLTDKIARTDGKVILMEEKSCRKHQEILATSNKYYGRLEKEIDEFKNASVTRDQLDRLIEVNQTEIAEHRKKIREME
ncbi:MAG TPA: hypothetical protein DHV62_09650, partial [Elusimicrobia bacterium]|nr:hypothetical protein [Elusimicrobiota bacterium]